MASSADGTLDYDQRCIISAGRSRFICRSSGEHQCKVPARTKCLRRAAQEQVLERARPNSTAPVSYSLLITSPSSIRQCIWCIELSLVFAWSDLHSLELRCMVRIYSNASHTTLYRSFSVISCISTSQATQTSSVFCSKTPVDKLLM